MTLALALASSALASEDSNPYQGLLPETPPYLPDQRIVISDPPDGAVLTRSPERITVNFRRFDFEDLVPSSLELWIDGVEYSERLVFWTDVAWVDLPPDLLGPGEHVILANITEESGLERPTSSVHSNVSIISIFLPCPGGCPWPFSPTNQPHVVSNLMENWQDFGSTPYFHAGLDIRTDSGTPVRACAAGTVVKKINYRPNHPQTELYWEVAIQDATGMIWQYHHLDGTSITVNQGDVVAQGQVIGEVVEWTAFMNGERYNHLHLNTVRWQGGGAIPGPYIDGWRYYNPLNYLTRGTYTDAVQPLAFDVYFGANENGVPFAAESDAMDPVLPGKVDVLVREKDEMTNIGPDPLGQPYDLGLYDLSWSAVALDTPCKMGWVPRTRLARFDMVPGGTTVAGNEAALKKIYRQTLVYGGDPFGALYGYSVQRFTYALTNTKNGFPDDINGYWDTGQTGGLGDLYPDGRYLVKVYSRDFEGNETVTTVPVTLSNGKTWTGICPPYIVSLRVLQGPYLMTATGGSYFAQPIEVPLALGPVDEGSALATVDPASWPAWNFDLPGLRVAVGLLNGHPAQIEYVPLLGDVIVTLDAEAQVLPPGGAFDPDLPPTNPVSLRLSTRLARDPAGPALIGRPAARGETTFDLVMAKPILVNGEPMTLRLEAGATANAAFGLDPVSVSPGTAPSASAAVRVDVSPNPIATGATLALVIAGERALEVDVLDAQGRGVRRVFRGRLPTGTHRLRWDAHDASGAALPAGIYFVRARGDDVEARRKVVVVR